MAHIRDDRIFERSNVTGTGDITLGGAIPGYFAFGHALADGDTCEYAIERTVLGFPVNEFEYGIGTYRSTGDLIERTTTLGGSNGTSPVDFAAGPKRVALAILAPNSDTAQIWRDSLELGSVSLLSFPGGTTDFLRADGTWATPPGASSVAWGDITGTLGDQTDLQSALDLKADISSLSTVATSGAYSDLSGKPSLGTVAPLNLDSNTAHFLRGDGTFTTPTASAAWGSITGTISAQTDLGDIAVINSDGATNHFLRGDKAWAVPPGTNWGSIGGTLSAQTDISAALAAKEASITAGTTAQYWRGDKTFQTLNATAVGLSAVANKTNQGPAFKAARSTTDQSVGLATPTALFAQQVLADSNSKYFNNGTATYFQPALAGYYQFNVTIAFQLDGGGQLSDVRMYLYANGVQVSELALVLNTGVLSSVIVLSGSDMIALSASDYVQAVGYLNGTGTITNAKFLAGLSVWSGFLARAS